MKAFLNKLGHKLRHRSEYALRLAAMRDVAGRYPGMTVKSALPPVGAFWRYLFVPLFRRVPWSYKRSAMRAARMTARGWQEDAPQFGEPWRPPSGNGRVPSTSQIEQPQEPHPAG